jgi:ribosomal protein S18 acetylase RimI-like enzyme
MNIEEITQYSNDILDALKRFLPQVASSTLMLSEADLRSIILSDSSHVLMAEEKGEYIGSLTLVLFATPTRTKALIEDLVVDEEARGQGVGRLLLEHAIGLARASGAKTIDLTSRPARTAANALYQKLGFSLRETNVYRYECE